MCLEIYTYTGRGQYKKEIPYIIVVLVYKCLLKHLCINCIICILKCNNCIMMYVYEEESCHVLCKVVQHVPSYRSHPGNRVNAQRKKGCGA